MQAKVPVLACTEPNTDLGKVIVEGGFVWWCSSPDPSGFSACMNAILQESEDEVKKKWELAWLILNQDYIPKAEYHSIVKQ